MSSTAIIMGASSAAIATISIKQISGQLAGVSMGLSPATSTTSSHYGAVHDAAESIPNRQRNVGSYSFVTRPEPVSCIPARRRVISA